MKRKIVSYMTIFLLLFGIIPFQDITAYAAFNPDRYYVDYITVTKIYERGGYSVSQTKLTIHGGYLQGATVGTMTSTGYLQFTGPTINTDSVLEYVVAGDKVGSSIDVGSISIPINQSGIPTISGIDKRSVKVNEEGLIINGSNLNNLVNNVSGYSAYYENKSGAGGTISIPINMASSNASTITTTNLSGTPGFQSVVVQKALTTNIDFQNTNTNKISSGADIGKNAVNVVIQNTYLDQFRLINKINVTDFIMNPNRGQAGVGAVIGDEVQFTAASGLDDYDVFFLKNLTDKFTNENKGVQTTFNPNVDSRQVLTTHLPPKSIGKIENGEYYVVITNKIPAGKDPDEEVNKQYIVGAPTYEKFTIIDANQKMNIISIRPNEGPDTGSKVDISGVFLGTLNLPEFLPSSTNKTIALPTGTDENMTITYSGGTYKGVTVNSAVRKLKVIVGDVARFARKANNTEFEYNFTDALDTISIITPQITDAEANPIKDVVIESITTLTLANGSTIVIKERAEVKGGYTFKASKITPRITSITPGKIQVTRIADGDYRIGEERLIAITGDNFMIHKFIKPDGTEVVRYPIIELGNDTHLRLNKNANGVNSNPNLKMKVYDRNGNELDGSVGNEIGTKIIVYIPANTQLSLPGRTYVKIINPIRNTETEGLSDKRLDGVDFVEAEDRPVIENVEPNIVTVTGGEDIAITGSNFKEGVKVYIDGTEVTGITRQGDGRRITFKSLPGREGQTQLQVMNSSGAIAIAEYTYVRTFTDPKITEFSPNKGSNGTLVVLKGDNLLKPDPSTTDITGANIYKIIGTRILFDGRDLNIYNKDVNNRIELKNYIFPSAPILYTDSNNVVKLSGYYNSVILQESGRPNYYTFDVNTRNEVVLSNGKNESYTIINKVGSNFIAIGSNGSEYTINLNANNITITQAGVTKTLYAKTVYAFDANNVIYGNAVKVLNKNELLFTVPILSVEKWYNLSVQNPDTKKVIRMGEQGFYYFKTPKKNPIITALDPNQGSVDGGYTVDIDGGNFESNGDIKSRVFVGGVEVPARDVVINTGKNKITITIPRYPGDLKTEIDGDRKTVPVVIVNSDGGNAKKEDGFTYVIPTSNPRITKVLPNTANAAGGEVIQLWGSDFRYFEPYVDSNGNATYDTEDRNSNNILDSGEDTNNNGKLDIEKFVDLNGNGRFDDIEGRNNITITDRNILPRVYFGKKLGEIVDYADGYLSVRVPASVKGNVEIYVLNNDYGTSNKMPFTYTASSPTITNVTPKIGKKQGRDNIEIIGTDFTASNVDVYDLWDNVNAPATEEKRQMELNLVRFGNINDVKMSNKSIAAGNLNAGTIIGTIGETNVGDLSVRYNSSNPAHKTLSLSITVRNAVYTNVINDYDDNDLYVAVDTLKFNNNGVIQKYTGNELVKISVDSNDRRIIVERGYAPITNSDNSTQIEVNTPSYYTIGKVPVTVINPDGGSVASEFEYKNPDSYPVITNITKELEAPSKVENINGKNNIKVIRLNYKAQNNISILGTDFRENAKITIGDILEITPDKITPNLPGKLTFKMPIVDYEKVKGKLYKVIVNNEDGASASSETISPNAIYIIFTKGETTPILTQITPNSGYTTGGYKVKLEGSDFRRNVEGYDQKLNIYFGSTKLADDKIEYVDYKTINVTVPAGIPGKIDVRLENPDGETTILKDAFTYLSNPRISSVVSPTNESAIIDSISIEGGEGLKIKGLDFMAGSKVIFNPVIEPTTDASAANTITIGGSKYILKSGTEGTVTFVDTNNLKVITPSGVLDTKGMIVVNPDKSATDVYNGIRYTIARLPAPSNVVASIHYDRYIKVSWDSVANARSYEIYAIVGSGAPFLIGSTQGTTFVYQNVTSNTTYKFVVKTLGEYGLSFASITSNSITMGSTAGPPNTDGNLNDNTIISKTGDTANVYIGMNDGSKNMVIDLVTGDLAQSKQLVISMPAKLISNYGYKNIAVRGNDFSLSFTPSAFNVDRIESNKTRNDVGVRLTLSLNKEKDISSLSNEYVLKADAYVGKDLYSLDFTKSNVSMNLDFDTSKAEQRKLSNIGLYRLDEERGNWLLLNSRKDNYSTFISGTSNRLGKYAVLGRR